MPEAGNGFEALAYMNFFRILADLTHAFSKIILIWAIHRNRSAEGKLLFPLYIPTQFPCFLLPSHFRIVIAVGGDSGSDNSTSED